MQNPSGYGVAPAKSSTGLDANVAALLAYIFGLVSGVIFYVIEKDSPFVKFHAMQSILFNAVVAVIAIGGSIILMIVTAVLNQISGVLAGIVGLLSLLFWVVFFLAVFAGFILCLIKAYQGQMFKLPIVGNMAAKIVNK
jgi:uncharacterized membrane protein